MFCFFQPLSAHHLPSTRLTGAGYAFVCVCVCVCVCSYYIRECVCACVCIWALTTLSQHLQQSVVAERARAEKAQKPQFLHQPELAGCVVWCLLDHNYPPLLLLLFFPFSANFPYSHWSITLNECQSFRPAVGSKQRPPLDKTTAVYQT